MTDMSYCEKTRTLCVQLSGELDHHAARRLREDIDRRLFETRPEVLTLDFSRVGFMDSSGLGLILGRAEAAASVGGTLVLSGLSDTHRRLVQLSGIEKLRCVRMI